MSPAHRPKTPHETLYPRNRLFDEPHSPRGNGLLVAVALLAAAVGVFALTRSTAQSDTPPDTTAVAEAVRDELHTMFLTDLGADSENPGGTEILRSATTRSTTTTRITGLHPGDSVALRCHGPGKLHITRLSPTHTSETQDVPCGRTALHYLLADGTLQTVHIHVDTRTSWASWAVTRPNPR
ncbi:hypothetical protein ACFU5Z_08225 [Streptomyces sp. NPDC057521]|uniref:hypothetical protein n=1 Tax=Streptomyces sp. NPDC057521 TaxID=3346156 RepID=UPI0036AA5CD9